MDLSIIIVNWNSSELLGNCLASIDKWVTGIRYEAIVVDNGSSEAEVCYLKSELEFKYTWARFIYSAENLGFSRGNNLGAAQARGKYLLLLNPDTCFIQAGFDRLVEKLKQPELGMIGCKLLNADKTPQKSCFYFPVLWRVFVTSLLLHKILPAGLKTSFETGDHEREQYPDWVMGAFMLLTKSVFERCGGFDEAIFMYGEDMELCYQVRKLRLEIWYTPEFSIIHYQGESGKKAWSQAKREARVYQAVFYFYRKHFGPGQLALAKATYALGALMRMAGYGISSLLPGRFQRGLHGIRVQWTVLMTQFGQK